MQRVWARHAPCWEPLLSMLVGLITWSAVTSETCEELQCLHGNPCQTVISHGNNLTQARCQCGGRWAGPRCEHVIQLTSEVVTSSRAQLRLDLMSFDMDGGGAAASVSDRSTAMSLVSPEAMEKIALNYTLVYWRRNDSYLSQQPAGGAMWPATDGHVSCVLLQGKHSKTLALEGLIPRTRYTICVENGFLDSCYLSSIAEMRSAASSSSSSSVQSSSSSTSFSAFTWHGRTSNWPSNCVTVFTPGASSAPKVPTTPAAMVTAVASVSVVVLVVLIMVFTVFLLRRQSRSVRSCLDAAFCDSLCYSPCCPAPCGQTPPRSYMEELTSLPPGRSRRFLGEVQARRGQAPRRTSLGRLLGRKSATEEDARASAALLMLSPSSSSASVGMGGLGGAFPDLEASLAEIDPLAAETGSTQLDPAFADPYLVQLTFAPHPARPKRGHRSGRRKRGHGRRKEQVARLTPVLEASSENEMGNSELLSPDDASA